MHSHSRRQLILESGCSHQVAVFPLCQCPLFLHLFLLLQLCMASRQTGQKFFWFIFWLQASLHHQLLNVLISLFKLSQAVQAKQKNACLLAGRSARFLPAQFTILFGDLKVCYTIVSEMHKCHLQSPHMLAQTDVDDVIANAGAMGQAGWKTRLVPTLIWPSLT